MNDHAPALCSEAVCAACDAYGAGCSRRKDAPSEALPELARVGNPVTLRPCYYSASALVLLRRRLRRGADPLSASQKKTTSPCRFTTRFLPSS